MSCVGHWVSSTHTCSLGIRLPDTHQALCLTLVVPLQGERGLREALAETTEEGLCLRGVEGRRISTRGWNLWNLLNTHMPGTKDLDDSRNVALLVLRVNNNVATEDEHSCLKLVVKTERCEPSTTKYLCLSALGRFVYFLSDSLCCLEYYPVPKSSTSTTR